MILLTNIMSEGLEVGIIREQLLEIAEKIKQCGNGEQKMIIFWKELKPLVSNINLLEIYPDFLEDDYVFLTLYTLKYGLLRLWKNLYLDSPYDAETYLFFKDFIEKLVEFINTSLNKNINDNIFSRNLIISLNNFILSLYHLLFKKNEREEKVNL